MTVTLSIFTPFRWLNFIFLKKQKTNGERRKMGRVNVF